MHESALAKQILGAVLDRIGSQPGLRVLQIHARVIDCEALSADRLALHFASHARGTSAEGARLDLEVIRVSARCARCRGVYAPELYVLLCPDCGSTEGECLVEPGICVDTAIVEEGGHDAKDPRGV